MGVQQKFQGRGNGKMSLFCWKINLKFMHRFSVTCISMNSLRSPYMCRFQYFPYQNNLPVNSISYKCFDRFLYLTPCLSHCVGSMNSSFHFPV